MRILHFVYFLCIFSLLKIFRPNGTILVGSRAVEQQEHNPFRTIYDAKRFIGKVYNKDDLEFQVNIFCCSYSLLDFIAIKMYLLEYRMWNYLR